MADYIKREDAIRAIAEGSLIFASSQLSIDAAMLSAFSKIKKADVVEVVRCKDCKHFEPVADDSKYDGLCRSPASWRGYRLKRDDFCSVGERKKDKMEKLWCTDWSAVATIARVKAARFRESNSDDPTIVIFPVGSISEMREECSEYMTCGPHEEPVRFCGLRVIESPRIKNYAEIEVY